MVFPNTLLFINSKKSFSKLFLACVLMFVLKSMYFFNHRLSENSNALCTLFNLSPKLGYSSKVL